MKQPDLDTLLRWLSHIPIEHQVNWLRSEIAKHPHSQRSNELRPILKKKFHKQMRREIRAA